MGELVDEKAEHHLLQVTALVIGVAGMGEVALLGRVEGEVVQLELVGFGSRRRARWHPSAGLALRPLLCPTGAFLRTLHWVWWRGRGL